MAYQLIVRALDELAARAEQGEAVDLAARHLYVVMAELARADGVCRAGIPQLSERSGLHERTVRRARAELEAAGLIEPMRASRPGVRYRYRLTPLTADETGREARSEVIHKPGASPGLELSTPGERPGKTGRGARKNRARRPPVPVQSGTDGARAGRKAPRGATTAGRAGSAAQPALAVGASPSRLSAEEIVAADAWLAAHPADLDRLKRHVKAEVAAVPAAARHRTATARLRQLALAEMQRPEAELVQRRPFGETPGAEGREWTDHGLRPLNGTGS